jgi:hypothetical protein
LRYCFQQFAAVIGEIIADLATTGTTAHDISRFTIGRFAGKRAEMKRSCRELRSRYVRHLADLSAIVRARSPVGMSAHRGEPAALMCTADCCF